MVRTGYLKGIAFIIFLNHIYSSNFIYVFFLGEFHLRYSFLVPQHICVLLEVSSNLENNNGDPFTIFSGKYPCISKGVSDSRALS